MASLRSVAECNSAKEVCVKLAAQGPCFKNASRDLLAGPLISMCLSQGWEKTRAGPFTSHALSFTREPHPPNSKSV